MAYPRYQNKSSTSCFVNPRLCLLHSNDCQVTFRNPRSLSFYLFAMVKIHSSHFSSSILFLLKKNKFIVIQNAVPWLNGFCLK